MPKQYKVTPGFLVEKLPDKQFGRADHWNTESEAEHNDAYEAYMAYQATAQRIPIPPNVSFEGEIINEDQFEVKRLDRIGMEHPDGDPYAYPVKPKQPEGKEKGEVFEEQPEEGAAYLEPSPQPQPTQEEMWEQVNALATTWNYKEFLEFVSKTYHIQKKNP